MKKISLFLLSLVLIFSLSVSVLAKTTKPVKLTEEEVIKTVQDNKVMEGTDKGFEPTKTLTRAEITAIVVRIMGLSDESVVDVDFEDVNKKHWAYKDIAIAYHEGYVKGIGNNQFAPDNEVTIGEAVTILLRALTDTTEVEKEGNWPDNYMAAAKDNEFMIGLENKTGNDLSLRIDTARMIANMIKQGKLTITVDKKEPVKNKALSGIILDVAEIVDGNELTLVMPGGVIKSYNTDSSELKAGTLLPGTLISFWYDEEENVIWDIEAETVTKLTSFQNVLKVMNIKDGVVKGVIKDKDETKEYRSRDWEYLACGNIIFLKADECRLAEIEGEKDDDENQLYMRLYQNLQIASEDDIELLDEVNGKFDELEGTEVFYQTIEIDHEDTIIAMIFVDED